MIVELAGSERIYPKHRAEAIQRLKNEKIIHNRCIYCRSHTTLSVKEFSL